MYKIGKDFFKILLSFILRMRKSRTYNLEFLYGFCRLQDKTERKKDFLNSRHWILKKDEKSRNFKNIFVLT